MKIFSKICTTDFQSGSWLTNFKNLNFYEKIRFSANGKFAGC